MNYTKKLFLFFSFILLLVTISCKSQVTVPEIIDSESWVRHWGSEENDIAEDMAVTNNGIYITGVTLGELKGNKSTGEWDIFLTKYNIKGDYEWTVQWGTEGRDSGTGIGADSTGIYITGYINGSLDGNIYYGEYDVFLTKFNFTGTKLWTVQVGTSGDDCGRGLEVNSSGIYVTGYTEGDFDGNNSAGGYDIFLTKFNTEGDIQWTRQWGTENTEWGNDVSVSPTGIYVTGHTQGDLYDNKASGFDDIFLTKFDLEGTQQWTRQWGTENNDVGYSLVADSTGIYVTGRTGGDLDGNKRIKLDDIFITKYNSEGNKQWTKILGTKATDKGMALAIEDKSIFITGITCGEFEGNKKFGDCDTFIVNYNLSGEKLWLKQWGTGGFDFTRAITFKDTNMYICGDTSFGLDNKKNERDNRDSFLEKIRIF